MQFIKNPLIYLILCKYTFFFAYLNKNSNIRSNNRPTPTLIKSQQYQEQAPTHSGYNNTISLTRKSIDSFNSNKRYLHKNK